MLAPGTPAPAPVNPVQADLDNTARTALEQLGITSHTEVLNFIRNLQAQLEQARQAQPAPFGPEAQAEHNPPTGPADAAALFGPTNAAPPFKPAVEPAISETGFDFDLDPMSDVQPTNQFVMTIRSKDPN